MHDNSERLQYLFKKYLDNKLSREELLELLNIVNDTTIETALSPELKSIWINAAKEQISLPDSEWDSKMHFLMRQFDQADSKIISLQQRTSWYGRVKWVAASILVVILSGSIYWFMAHTGKEGLAKTDAQANQIKDIGPGTEKAILTLADGTKISLDSAANGLLTQQGNTTVIKQANGKLRYNKSNEGSKEIGYNVLIVPRGGQYQVELADGSKVWLNANSSLRYPTAFTGSERKVEITGEAYFEVAKDASKPFKVKLNKMEIEVLGTHFNVNAYEDEPAIRATLLEGRIKIKQDNAVNFLKPGQQARLDKNGKMELKEDADLEEAVAWKEGKFQFEEASVDVVMRQIARWYDVDVEYKGIVSEHFGGTISRNVNLSKVLSMLELTGGVKFDVDGKKIIVQPSQK